MPNIVYPKLPLVYHEQMNCHELVILSFQCRADYHELDYNPNPDPIKAAYWTKRAEKAEKALAAAYPPKPFNGLIIE